MLAAIFLTSWKFPVFLSKPGREARSTVLGAPFNPCATIRFVPGVGLYGAILAGGVDLCSVILAGGVDLYSVILAGRFNLCSAILRIVNVRPCGRDAEQTVVGVKFQAHVADPNPIRVETKIAAFLVFSSFEDELPLVAIGVQQRQQPCPAARIRRRSFNQVVQELYRASSFLITSAHLCLSPNPFRAIFRCYERAVNQYDSISGEESKPLAIDAYLA